MSTTSAKAEVAQVNRHEDRQPSEALKGILGELPDIRYPSDSSAPPPQDMAEAIEQEKRALETRYAPILNRRPGEAPSAPKLTVIDGGKKQQE